MEELLSKIYERIVFYEKDCISLGTEFDRKLAKKLATMEGSISDVYVNRKFGQSLIEN